MTDLRPRLGRSAMLDWTDRAEDGAVRRPATGGPALAALVRAAAPAGHVLIAGVHGEEIIDAAAETAARLTLLARGTVDGERLAAAYPEAEVVVGDLGDLEGPYDMAVLLDGLTRIPTAETEPTTWSALHARVTELAAALLLGLENPLAPVASLASPGPLAADRDDDWPTLRAVPASAEGLTPDAQLWSAFGTPAAPALVMPAGGHPALAVAHTPPHVPGVPGVDLRLQMQLAADAGLTDAYASRWILSTRPVTAAPLTASGPITEPPAGVLLETVALRLLASHGEGELRTLLGAAAAAGVADPAAAVVTAHGEVVALGISPAAMDLATALAIRACAIGCRHPWPAASTTTELAALLAAAAGLTPPPAAPADAPDGAHADPDVTRGNEADALAADRRRTEATQAREAAFRKELDLADRRITTLTNELEKVRERIQRVRHRENALKNELAALTSSRSYRLGRSLTAPIRAVRGTSR